CGRGGLPGNGRDLLDPAQVNDVVDVVLLVDVRRLDHNGHFERPKREWHHWRVRQSKRPTLNVQRPMSNLEDRRALRGLGRCRSEVNSQPLITSINRKAVYACAY